MGSCVNNTNSDNYSVVTTANEYTIEVSNSYPQWLPESIDIPVNVTIITNVKFKSPVKNIMFLNGAVFAWKQFGCVIDEVAGTLDVSAYNPDGISGTLDFEYFS